MRPVTESAAELERCAHLCHECQDECLRLIRHCLDKGGPHSGAEHVGVLMDCVVICGASHNLLHRSSRLHTETCRACAAICDACADDCERLAGDDREMSKCAEICRRCADSCRQMSGDGGRLH